MKAKEYIKRKTESQKNEPNRKDAKKSKRKKKKVNPNSISTKK